jgi:hypothetical protein
MEKQSTEFEFFVAGVQHHSLHSYIDEILEGDILQLVKEPENKYDHNAIKIVYLAMDESACMIGYVPGKLSAAVTAFIDTAESPTCYVTQVNPDAKPWNQLKVLIKDDEENSNG